MLKALAKAGWIKESAALDSTSIKAHRCAHGGKGEAKAQAIGRRAAAGPPRSTSWSTSSAARR